VLIELVKFRKGNVLLEHTASGSFKWSKVGQKIEVEDSIGHSLLGKYPDMLKQAVAKAPVRKAPLKEPEKRDQEGNVVGAATRRAQAYANKSL